MTIQSPAAAPAAGTTRRRGGVAALIFDWDGTLVDTEQANRRSLAAALAPYDIVLSPQWFAANSGLSIEEMMRELARGSRSPIDVGGVIAARDAIFLREVGRIREHRDVAKIARAFHGDLPLAVASGGTRRLIEAAMKVTALEPLFDVLVTREDVAWGKPEPDLFLLAARHLDVDPSRCLVYEDSDQGVEAAIRAGMPVVDVRRGRSATQPA